MNVTSVTVTERKRDLLAALRQFTLAKGRTWQLPQTFDAIKVVDGCIWVSYEGRDKILRAGDQFRFDPRRGSAIVSAEGCLSAVLEVMGR